MGLAEEAQNLVGDRREDFLKSCWRWGTVSQSQTDAWVQGLQVLLTLGREGLGSRQPGKGQGFSGADGAGPNMGNPGPQPQPCLCLTTPSPSLLLLSQKTRWIQGLGVVTLRRPLQASASASHTQSPLLPCLVPDPHGLPLPLYLQLQEELWHWRTGTGAREGGLPSHPKRVQAAGLYDLCRNYCHIPFCPAGAALGYSGARLFPRLGQPGFSRRQREKVSILEGGEYFRGSPSCPQVRRREGNRAPRAEQEVTLEGGKGTLARRSWPICGRASSLPPPPPCIPKQP